MSGGGSSSKSESNSQANTSQDVWGPQGQALSGMYQNANDLWGQTQGMQDQLGNQANQATGNMQDVFDSQMGGMNDQLQGGAYGDTDAIRSQLLDSMGQRSNTGQMYENIVGGPGNSYIDPMVEAMRNSGMQQMKTMRSGTGLKAAALGQGGSSRHAMQNSMNDSQIAQDMNRQEFDMRSGAYDTDLNWKMDIARMADGNRQQEQDRMMGMLSGANSSQQYGMGQGQSMQNLGMGMMAPNMQVQNQGWGNMDNYANAIGGPTVLQQGEQSGSSKSSAGGSGGGMSK